jgi:hypothetical protein
MLQLDLFEGVVLTVEQEQKVAKFKEDKNKNAKKFQLENQQIEGTLVEAGFVKGVDFENTFETKVVTRDVELGYSFNDTNFTAQDVTYTSTFGGVSFLSKRYSKENDVINDTVIKYFDFQGGKFECSSLTGNYRKIKPTTLLTKLQEQREQAEIDMKTTRERNNGFEIATNELKTKFPAANILKVTDYDGYGARYRTVTRLKAQFENGSYVTFNVSNDGSYRVAKKYDANFAAMDSNEVMEFFTNQNK